MSKTLCPSCYSLGYCRREYTALVTDKDLNNPEFIRDGRKAAYSENLFASQWLDHVTDLYRDYLGWIADENGEECFLDTEVFDRPNIEDWFDDWCCAPCPEHIKPRLRCEARERVRVLLTILKTRHPVASRFWGVRPANDNAPLTERN